jgi:hypothetical protein
VGGCIDVLLTLILFYLKTLAVWSESTSPITMKTDRSFPLCNRPLRLEFNNFTGPLPPVKQVLAHFLQLSKEAQESRPGMWSRQEFYNTTAADLLALCADNAIADNVVVWVKVKPKSKIVT